MEGNMGSSGFLETSFYNSLICNMMREEAQNIKPFDFSIVSIEISGVDEI